MVPDGHCGGGIALLWKEQQMAKILAYSSNFIDVVVSIPRLVDYRLTSFYGCHERSRRRHSWDLLRIFSHRLQLPWSCCIGDFSDFLSQCEKRRQFLHSASLINGF